MVRSLACLAALLLVTACGSSGGTGKGTPATPGPSGGSGGSPGTGGAGGTVAVDAAVGTGGAAGESPPPPGVDAGKPAADAGSGGSADAATPPPSPTGEAPLPACLRTVPVSASADLATAVNAAQPGDCIVLADGNYSFPVVSKAGTEAAPIVIRAANRGKAVLNSGALFINKSAYVVIEGLDITTSGAAVMANNGGSNGMIIGFNDSHYCRLTRNRIHPQGYPADRDWIVLDGGTEAHHNRLDHNEFGPLVTLANMIEINGTGSEEPPMAGQVSQYNQVDHNYFHDVKYSGGNNWETIRIGRSWEGPTAGFNVIEFNLLVACNGDPETISAKSSDNTIRYNTMRNTVGEICLRHGNRNKVYGNYLLGDGNGGSRGMRVYGADHRIYNNYVATSATGIWLDDGESSATDEPGKNHYQVYRAWVFNNTVVGQEIKVGGTKANSPTGCKIANNIVIGSGLNAGGNQIVDEGNLIGGANPLSMVDGVFRLGTGAEAARAAGKAVNAASYMIADDIDGQPRGPMVDVGADQQSSAPVLYKGPLTPADVGIDAP
jgi:poly(beta-D-mannuronate) lyase